MTSGEMAKKIADRVQVPAQWNAEVRRIATALGLDFRRIAFQPKLIDTCFSLLSEAEKRRRTAEQIAAAVG